MREFATSVRALLAGAFALLLVSGCGGSGGPKTKLYPVSGKVTIQGAPMKDVQIVFAPEGGGDGGHGTLGPDGSYTLQSLDGRPGCPAGKFKVVFQMPSDAVKKAMEEAAKSGQPMMGPPAIKTPYPPEFGDVATSPKDVEVQAKGENKIDIAL